MSELTDEEHNRIRDDLAAYALDALEGDEVAAIERHLDECEECRAWLRWLRPAVDVLPASVGQLTPPDRVREELLATVRAEAAEAGHGSAARPAARRRRGWLRVPPLRPAAALAAVLLLAAGVGAGYLLRGPSGDSESAFLEAQAPSALAGDVSATLERKGDSGTLHVQELPRLDRDSVYEVWIQRAGAMEPGPLFTLHEDGSAAAAVPGLEAADAVLVTREPRGGSRQPTGPPLLRVSLD